MWGPEIRKPQKKKISCKVDSFSIGSTGHKNACHVTDLKRLGKFHGLDIC
jgi:hypothetical protein